MLSARPDQSQFDMFSPILKSFIDPQHALVQLADRLDWDSLEAEFAELYSDTGRQAHPVRLMVSLLVLKQMYGQGMKACRGVDFEPLLFREWVVSDGDSPRPE
ncbi:MAG: hypothetical protein U5K69_05020 [Balneolaceae bacterium]|nr:hypothetical protein [Balneolaceae bacterium]